MWYRVINKDGNVAQIQYICFGALSMVDAWYSEFTHQLTFLDSTGEEYEPGIEERNGCKYHEGFYPANFSILQYIPPMDENSGVEFFINHPELLDHPLFGGVELVADANQYYFNIKMEGRKMDETLYPLIVIRNLCEYTNVRNTFSYMLEEGYQPIPAMFIASIVQRSVGMYGDKHPWFSIEGSDAAIIHSAHAPLGDVVELINGEMPFIFSDRRWDETDQGYSAYGRYATKFEPWGDDYDDWDDEDEDEVDVIGETVLPLHPILGRHADIVSVSAFRNKEEYPDELRQTLWDSRPTTDDSFKTFLDKVMNYVKAR